MNVSAKRMTIGGQAARPRFAPRTLLAIVVVYACMLPRELSFEVVEIAIQPFRLMLILFLPVAVMLWGQQRMRPCYVDWLVVFAAIWAFLALYVTASLSDAMVTGLSDGLNMALAYFIGRVSIRTSKDLQNFFVAVLPGLLLCAGIIAIESLTHQNLLRPYLASVFGAVEVAYPNEYRLGLLRAQGPFPHPILGGVFMASFLPIAWYMPEKPMTRFLGLLAVGGFFFSVSSTGFLGVIVGGGLIFTAYLHRVTKLPVFQAVIAGAIFMGIFIELFSGGGLFSFIVRRLTFSAGTGRYRMLIWEYGGADALNHPLFGIGMRNYIRPAWMVKASVDAHWLLVTLRYGFPFGIAALVIMLSGAFMSLRGAWSPYPLDRRAAYAIGFSLIAIAFTGLSVFLWEGMAIWMTVLTGIGVTFGQQMVLATRSQAAGYGQPSTLRLRPGAT